APRRRASRCAASRRRGGAALLRGRRATRSAAHDARKTDSAVPAPRMPQTGEMKDLALDSDGPVCPACWAEMTKVQDASPLPKFLGLGQ
ncbi:hypothetical protein, partial [Cryobacterium sp. TMT2-10]